MNWRTLLSRSASLRSHILAVLIGMIVLLTGMIQPWTDVPPARFREAASQPLKPAAASSLSIAAQSGISARIGQDQVAYHANSEADALHMNNPAHDLSAIFGGEGVQIARGGQTWGLSLVAHGRGETLETLGTASPRARENRIEYQRGAITEWYMNGPFGLEQGFDLSTRPDGGEANVPMTLVLQLSGNMQARLDADRRGVTLSASDGSTALRYGGLTAFDADRQELTTWLELRGSRLLVRVDETEARYPIQIDPVIFSTELTASDKAVGDNLGTSVAISGDTVVVGAPMASYGTTYNAGAAYVFLKPGGGWSANLTQVAKLTAPDKAAGNNFGSSVAISGDTIVVGVPNATSGGTLSAGAAYVFAKPGGGWSGTLTQAVKLTASDKLANDYLGASVAISGDTIVVGAPDSDPGSTTNAGAVYVFVQSPGGWGGICGIAWGGVYMSCTQTAKLTASDKSTFDELGTSVSISGDTIVAGALYDYPGGAAYVFVKPTMGWANATQTAKLTASDNVIGDDNLGTSVGISGDTVVAGAPYADPGGTTDAGAVYVFVKPAGGWGACPLTFGIPSCTQTAKLTASDKAGGDQLGNSVGISGDMVVAGAWSVDTGGAADAGAAYVFAKPGTGWPATLAQTAKLAASDEQVNMRFGISTGISGDMVVVGAMYASPDSTAFAGAAYVMLLQPDASLSTASLSFGSQAVGSTSTSQNVTLTNDGTMPLTISSIAASGNFAQTSNCPATLAVGSTCTINVTFTPTAGGARTGSLTITHSAPDSPTTVSLSGNGEAVVGTVDVKLYLPFAIR